MSDGVLQQVLHESVEQDAVAVDDNRACLGGDLQSQPIGLRPHEGQHAVDDLGEVNRPRVRDAVLGPGQGQQSVHQPLVAGIDLQQGLAEADQFGRGIGSAHRHLEQGLIDRQRCLELVRGVADELPLRCEGCVEAGQHGVDRGTQFPPLVPGSGQGDPFVQVAIHDTAGGGGDLTQRTQHRTSDEPACDQAGGGQPGHDDQPATHQRSQGLRAQPFPDGLLREHSAGLGLRGLLFGTRRRLYRDGDVDRLLRDGLVGHQAGDEQSQPAHDQSQAAEEQGQPRADGQPGHGSRYPAPVTVSTSGGSPSLRRSVMTVTRTTLVSGSMFSSQTFSRSCSALTTVPSARRSS